MIFYVLYSQLTSTTRHRHGLNGTYGAYIYGQGAVNAVMQHDTAKPLFLYLAFQNTHEPYEVRVVVVNVLFFYIYFFGGKPGFFFLCIDGLRQVPAKYLDPSVSDPDRRVFNAMVNGLF